MGNPVVHFEVMGKNPSALKTFYGDAFGWTFAPPMGPMEYAIVEPKAGGIRGGIGACPQGEAGHVTFYVAVPDVDAALAKIEELGGSTVVQPAQVPDGPTIAMIRDPEGHLVGLVEGR